jgi:hypothetical protein
MKRNTSLSVSISLRSTLTFYVFRHLSSTFLLVHVNYALWGFIVIFPHMHIIYLGHIHPFCFSFLLPLLPVPFIVLAIFKNGFHYDILIHVYSVL